MESKEYINYSRRAKIGERLESVSNAHHFHGYRTTKQWVEEASQQCREVSQHHVDKAKCMITPSIKKKDGRVHFKQENEEALARLTSSKLACHTSSTILRRDYFSPNQVAALSPISLNIAARGRPMSDSIHVAKPSPIVADQPHVVPIPKGEIAVISPQVKTTCSGKRVEEGRKMVWCNAAFEADDDFRSYKSQDSMPSSRLSTASCSKHTEQEVMKSLNKTHNKILTPRLSDVLAISSPNRFNPTTSNAREVVDNIPTNRMTKSPRKCCAQLELKSATGPWHTPIGSETTSHSSQSYSWGRERLVDLSKTRRNFSSMPTFKALSTNFNIEVKHARKVVNEIPSNCDPIDKQNSKQVVVGRAATPMSLVSDNSVSRNGTSMWIGKVEHCLLDEARTSCSTKLSLPQEALVEADLEADIEQEIEEEIAKEIIHLSQRLAALHAKQEMRRNQGSDLPKVGGISCPQTPCAPSLSGSDSGGKQKCKVVVAKFLQSKNDGTNLKQGPQKPIDKKERIEKSTPKQLGLSEGPFLGRANLPKRSLGTPARLLMKGKVNGKQRSCSPNHMVREELRHLDLEAQPRQPMVSDNKISREDFEGARIVASDMISVDKRLGGMVSQRISGSNEKKDWNQWNDNKGMKQIKRELQPAPSVSTSFVTVQQAQFFPEFERKLDWVKTLRSNTAYPMGMATPLEQTLDEKFLKQKSERQDIHAWLQENVGESESNGERSSFSLPIYGSGTCKGSHLEEGQPSQRMIIKEEDPRIGNVPTQSIPSWTPLKNGVTSLNHCTSALTTPTQCTPPWTTPYRCTPPRFSPCASTSRSNPSHYGTPIKEKTHGEKWNSSKMVLLENFHSKRQSCKTSPTKRIDVGFPMRKVSPTICKGYYPPSRKQDISPWNLKYGVGDESHIIKLNQKLEDDGDNNIAKCAKVNKKITIVAAEYEKFVQEGVQIEKHVVEVEDRATSKGEKGAYDPSRLDKEPTKKIFIRFSDLIKDKHFFLKDKLQQRDFGQSVLPSTDGQDSDDSVLIRSNTKTDSSEQGESISRSETSIIEETNFTCGKLFKERGDVEGVQFLTNYGLKESDESSTPNYDVVYDLEIGNPRVSPYLPEDYTLEMMLEYVDTLKIEREGLPRIRAIKDGVVGNNNSPRDSGCIKRMREGEGRAHFSFDDAHGGANNKLLVPNVSCLDSEGFSPNEIEGLDLESFWCLVGEMEGPKITHPC